jgi:hypothetical protein
MKMPNRILAIAAAAPAIPQKPSTPAIIDITKKTKAQYSMRASWQYKLTWFYVPLHQQEIGL